MIQPSTNKFTLIFKSKEIRLLKKRMKPINIAYFPISNDTQYYQYGMLLIQMLSLSVATFLYEITSLLHRMRTYKYRTQFKIKL